jgi:DNA-binding transcriptional MerR regulator
VTARSYLSIGDVLTLLREEFPDVTISKIRFLESQGLVNPERSPSGYRKFFEADVERLRWVLRQQREHFLPLKVIRDRLADGDLGEEEGAPSEVAAHANGKVPQPAHAVAGAGGAGGAGSVTAVGVISPATPTATASPEQSRADEEAMARILADASRRAPRIPDDAGEGHSLHAIPDPAAPAPPAGLAARVTPAAPAVPAAPEATTGVDTRSSPRTRAHTPASPTPTPAAAADSTSTARPPRHAPSGQGAVAPEAPVSPPGIAAEAAGPTVPPAASAETPPNTGGPSSGAGRGSGARTTATATSTGRQAGTAARATEPGAAAPREKGAVGAAGRPPAGPGGKNAPGATATIGMVTGASLTVEELCAASGLSEVELAGLQGFGLIEPFMVAGIPTFDEDALTVANLAAEFRKFGIEARHLRPYRNAVDREMGLIEQVIIPLLRQRNPESRQRAVEAADELGALGQTMRATLMRAALRRHVGG